PQGSALDNLLNPDGTINQQTVQKVLAGGAGQSNPSVALDQAWIRFDIAHVAFITAGRQHVKWGTSRIWNPTDYLTPARRNPLAFFDARLGASMVKVHVPWEAAGANFYALGLLDNAGPATLFRQLGGALRAEAVLFKTTEVGASALFQQGSKPKYALDVSTPLGPVDVYGEAALKQGSDVDLYRCTDEATVCAFETYRPEGWTPAASGGVEWTFPYTENKTATVGLEYFYNSNGYDSPRIYPQLVLQGAFTPFYLGKHYAALYGALIGPGNWDKVSFLMFNLANLSDRSFVSRLNFTVQVMTYLTVEAYGAVHYGTEGGEFRLGLEAQQAVINGIPVNIPKIPTPLWDAGMGLRVSL
ncbi:MAG TPA: hypothetical protein VND93_30330, partial [Myxococcales bacterium]|nr:hypothetical protein [Myxococcales bacterium]